MHYETFVALHGVLDRYPWARHITCDHHGSSAYDIASNRIESYGWLEAPAWAVGLSGGDWTGDRAVRELAWMSAEIPRNTHQPVFPTLGLARILHAGISRVGVVRLTGVHAIMPLGELRGDSSFSFDQMRTWFALADPQASIPVTLTTTAPSRTSHPPEFPVEALQDVLGDAARVTGPVKAETGGLAHAPDHLYDAKRSHGTLAVRIAVREWCYETAVWLIDAAGEALAASGWRTSTVVSASV